ncbi:MAG: zinc ribbon domain-containing protein [Chloroflexi bacterium]|nr:zinc ribbon domain-containing protein [Ardenticatenaceae bacterium]MBL1128575.1 zinc ribbon domain-containing protein [Chloroflexota bacterium]NOG34654.1 zinc ribbon domain-containing protein [Chloroflexota bacterium]
MPIYTYRCRSCHYEFDRNQRMSETPLVDCPSCGEPQLRKVVNSVGVVFKGSGFYVTDNRNGSTKAASSKSDGTAKSVAESKSDAATKSDSSTGAAKSSTSVEKAVAPAT